MRIFFLLMIALALSTPGYCLAQQHTNAGSTAEDVAVEQDACFTDAQKFCGGNVIFVFEMETCLADHLSRLSPKCRKQIAPTNFKKYYSGQDRPFGF